MIEETTVLPIASTQKRISAFVIDDLVIIFLIFLIFYEPLMNMVSDVPVGLTPEVLIEYNEKVTQFFMNNIWVIFFIKVLYHTFFVWQNGMTLGKYIMKIKVVDLETKQKPVFLKAFLRAVLRIVSEAFFYLGFLLAFFSPLKQTLHDKLSNCVVIDV